MIRTDLQEIAKTVTRRAQRQGYVIPREVREELARADLSEDQWKDVLVLAQAALTYRQGRYYYVPPVSARLQQEQQQQREIRQAIRRLIRHYRAAAARVERREQGRLDFIQPVKVHTEDRRELNLLSRDISTTGIRLIASRSLLGQKIRVALPQVGEAEPVHFLVRILWTCSVGDDLFENGGTFLELLEGEPEQLKVVGK
jgi:hypothetical protein